MIADFSGVTLRHFQIAKRKNYLRIFAVFFRETLREKGDSGHCKTFPADSRRLLS